MIYKRKLSQLAVAEMLYVRHNKLWVKVIEELLMLEKIVLAGIITFCVYLFLNLSSKSSNRPSLDARKEVINRIV